MILLYGRSPSGKTEYFKEQNKGEVRILHASDQEELKKAIISTQSVFEDPLPTLINTWFDLDCKELIPYQHYDVYIEAHYFETANGLRIVQKSGIKHYYGLVNENLIKTRKMFLKKERKTAEKRVDWVSILGTRYHYMQSMFSEIIK